MADFATKLSPSQAVIAQRLRNMMEKRKDKPLQPSPSFEVQFSERAAFYKHRANCPQCANVSEPTCWEDWTDLPTDQDPWMKLCLQGRREILAHQPTSGVSAFGTWKNVGKPILVRDPEGKDIPAGWAQVLAAGQVRPRTLSEDETRKMRAKIKAVYPDSIWDDDMVPTDAEGLQAKQELEQEDQRLNEELRAPGEAEMLQAAENLCEAAMNQTPHPAFVPPPPPDTPPPPVTTQGPPVAHVTTPVVAPIQTVELKDRIYQSLLQKIESGYQPPPGVSLLEVVRDEFQCTPDYVREVSKKMFTSEQHTKNRQR